MRHAAAMLFDVHTCPRCLVAQPVADFSPSSAYCRGCKRTYDRERAQQLAAGTWAPRVKADYERHQALALVPNLNLEPASSALTAEETLLAAMGAFLREHGFTALRASIARLEHRLAQANRVRLAREGWIA